MSGNQNSGRRPKPTALKLLEGNRGRRPLNDSEPQPRPVAPTMPEWFDDKAKRIWDETVAELGYMGTLASSDQAILAAFVQSYRNWQEYQIAANLKPVSEQVFISGSGEEIRSLKPSPFVRMAKDEKQAMRALGTLLGLDPSSRSRLRAGAPALEGSSGVLDAV